MRDVAKAVGVSISAVGQWERNEDTPSTDNLRKVCQFLRIDPGAALIGRVHDLSRPRLAAAEGEHIDSEQVAASLDYDGGAPRQAEPPFEGAVAQITGRMGGGSTGEVVTLNVGEMQTIEPVAAWWSIPGEALAGFGFRGALPHHIVGWFMDGPSMEPTIQRTDVVFIDTRRREPDSEGIFAVDFGEGRTLKRIRILRTAEGAKFELHSDNAARFGPLVYAPEEVTIFGRYMFRFTVF